MAGGRVLSHPDGIDAAQQMLNAVNGEVLRALNTFKNQGDRLNPDNFDGPRASAFYEDWPTYKSDLDRNIQQLGEMVDEIRITLDAIMEAGGNA